MSKPLDLSGQRFGRLVATERFSVPSGRGGTKWICRCDCGNSTIVATSKLRSGWTQSCGCLRKELAREKGLSNATHKEIHTKLYKTWHGMKSRCRNSPDEHCRNYGARGITVCEEWLNNYEAFRDWALANGYRDDLTIDRIDVNGNYDPSNCRWIDVRAQANNRRTNHFLTYNGQTHTVMEWSRLIGIEYNTLLWRITNGWEIGATLTTPVKHEKWYKYKKEEPTHA